MNRNEYAVMFSLLARNRTKYTECIKITRTDGVVYRFTSHDANIVIREPNESYYEYKSANSFILTSLETSTGLVVSNMDIDGLISDSDITTSDLRLGFLDNAKIELFIAYWASNSIKILPLRTSWVGEIQVEGQTFKADLRGIAQRLAQTFIQATSLECRWTFADGGIDGPSNFIRTNSGCGCGLNEAYFTDTYTVTSVENAKDTFECIGISGALPSNYYQWGKCRFTSGLNNGKVVEILYHYEKRIKLFLPITFEISNGDTVELVAGCAKTWAACGGFLNRRRFGGEPFLRGSDILSRYPNTPTNED